MPKYFARIDHTTQGPYSLSELISLGIRPRTYVWCKGMTEWTRAEDVADICRAWRCSLAGLPIPGEQTAANSSDAYSSDNNRNIASEADRLPPGFIRSFPEPPASPVDYDEKPKGVSIFMAVMLTILFFPLTGLLTIWYAGRFQYLWRQSEQEGISADTRYHLRVKAYENARLYRMMSLITVFITIALIGVLMAIRS